MRTTICQDCTRTFAAPNKATLYCPVCRLARNLNAFGTQTVRCGVPSCKNRFSPIQAKDFICWDHVGSTVRGMSRHGVTETCRVCKTEGARCYSEELRICARCLRDPQHRRDIIGRVNAKQKRVAAKP